MVRVRIAQFLCSSTGVQVLLMCQLCVFLRLFISQLRLHTTFSETDQINNQTSSHKVPNGEIHRPESITNHISISLRIHQHTFNIYFSDIQSWRKHSGRLHNAIILIMVKTIRAKKSRFIQESNRGKTGRMRLPKAESCVMKQPTELACACYQTKPTTY